MESDDKNQFDKRRKDNKNIFLDKTKIKEITLSVQNPFVLSGGPVARRPARRYKQHARPSLAPHLLSIRVGLLLSWSSLLRPVPRRGERAPRRRQSSGRLPVILLGLYASLPPICRRHLPTYTKFSLLRGCRFRDMMPRHMFLTGGGSSSSILLHGAKSRRVGSRSHGARFTRCCVRANLWRASDLRLKISPSEVPATSSRFLICRRRLSRFTSYLAANNSRIFDPACNKQIIAGALQASDDVFTGVGKWSKLQLVTVTGMVACAVLVIPSADAVDALKTCTCLLKECRCLLFILPVALQRNSKLIRVHLFTTVIDVFSFFLYPKLEYILSRRKLGAHHQ
jgi:hypothetical protein